MTGKAVKVSLPPIHKIVSNVNIDTAGMIGEALLTVTGTLEADVHDVPG